MVALALMLLCSALIQWTTVRETRVIAPASPDAASYVSYAYNLREYGVYSRTNTWSSTPTQAPFADDVSPPGYPLFLGLFLRDKPDVAFMQRVTLAQALLGVITTLLSFLLAARVLPSLLASAVGFLTALSPHLATISTYLLTESLFTCLLLASILAFVQAIQRKRMRDWIMAGVVFGLCCLVRPTLQLALPLALLLALLFPSLRWLRRPLVVALLAWGLLLGPWLAYKRHVPDQPGQVNLLRATLYHGSFPGFMYEGDRATYGYGYRYDPDAAQILASDANLKRILGSRIARDPGRYLHWYLLGKPGVFMSWGIVAGMGDIYIYPVSASPFLSRPLFAAIRGLMFALHWPLMLLGLGGAIMAMWRPRWLRLEPTATPAARTVALVILVAVVFHMIGAPYPRYAIPFRPLFYLLAVATLQALGRLLREPARSRAPGE